jgi:uncharacterized protein (DUF433 family)
MAEQAPTALNLSKYIDVSLMGDRPHVRGRRMPIATLVAFRNGEQLNISELAYAFTLTQAEVLAALLYYEEHRDEIDAYEQAYAAVTPEEWIKYGDDAPLRRRDDATTSSE